MVSILSCSNVVVVVVAVVDDFVVVGGGCFVVVVVAVVVQPLENSQYLCCTRGYSNSALALAVVVFAFVVV